MGKERTNTSVDGPEIRLSVELRSDYSSVDIYSSSFGEVEQENIRSIINSRFKGRDFGSFRELVENITPQSLQLLLAMYSNKILKSKEEYEDQRIKFEDQQSTGASAEKLEKAYRKLDKLEYSFKLLDKFDRHLEELKSRFAKVKATNRSRSPKMR